jgi:hypothetical protein
MTRHYYLKDVMSAESKERAAGSQARVKEQKTIALLEALCGDKPLNSNIIGKLKQDIQEKQIDFFMPVKACAWGIKADGTSHVSGPPIKGSAIDMILGFANQGFDVMKAILEEACSTNPALRNACQQAWNRQISLVHQLTVKETRFDGQPRPQQDPFNANGEAPSDVVWNVLVDHPVIDIHQPFKVSSGHNAHAHYTAEIAQKLHIIDMCRFSDPQRLDKLLKRYPHFSAADERKIARALDRNAALHPQAHMLAHKLCMEQAWSWLEEGKPVAVSWRANPSPGGQYRNEFRPVENGEAMDPDMPVFTRIRGLEDIKPYHMEMWTTLGMLPRIIASPVWEGREAQLHRLVNSMEPAYLNSAAPEWAKRVSGVRDGLIPRARPAQHWVARVAAESEPVREVG